MDEPPTSTGRALLSRAFEHWCGLHHGHSAAEIAQALSDEAMADPVGGRQVRTAARLIGELVAAGEIKASARPFGGGTPASLPATVWERDDFRQLFARSALDPARPFDPDATPTHWIFLDLGDFNRIVELSCADISQGAGPPPPPVTEGSHPQTNGDTGDNHVRMPELERRTGMSRATIYRRIKEGRFPKQISVDGNIASWRERDVAGWLANPW